ncbi:hypothetical protein A9Q84_14805 [Halobacteriovorax marinus]|uniref:AB hydrolase-1 domain-containing protein n=1 Tax=Halobacteriovorax marinus TaxID=97084 RepID=A0A1Y5F5J8_9BACT|nr:hypothetical protein A9Q84_14805 [Halobacteriovorax marinus]
MKKLIAMGIVILIILSFQISGKKIYQLNNFIEYKMANVAVSKIKLKGHDLSYYHGGIGEVVILLHGFGGSKENWNQMSIELTKHHQVYALDLPGFGETSPNKQSYNIQDYRDIVIDFIKALDLKNIKLVGHSTGGLIASSIAMSFPEYISKLWLISPLGADGNFESVMTKKLKVGENILIPNTIDEFENLLSQLFYKVPFIPSKVIRFVAKRSIKSNLFLERTFTATHGFRDGRVNILPSLNYMLGHFSKEIYLTWGKEDRILNYRGGVKIKKDLPQVHFNLQEGVGHMSLIEKVELPPSF